MFALPAPAARTPAPVQSIRIWSAVAAVVAVLCMLAMLFGYGYAMRSGEQVSRTTACASIDVPSARDCAPALSVVDGSVVDGIAANADVPEILSPAEPEEELAPAADRSLQKFPQGLRITGSTQQSPLPIRHLYSGRAPPGNA